MCLHTRSEVTLETSKAVLLLLLLLLLLLSLLLVVGSSLMLHGGIVIGWCCGGGGGRYGHTMVVLRYHRWTELWRQRKTKGFL